MRKIFGYLKPYAFLIILAVGLLFVQVNLDLALPDYMSKIVNIGIQQSGMDDKLPQVIRKSTLDSIGYMMNMPEMQAFPGISEAYPTLMSLYTPIGSGTADYEKLLGKYPGIENTETWVLEKAVKEITADDLKSARKLLAILGLRLMQEQIPESLRQMAETKSAADPSKMLEEEMIVNSSVTAAVKSEYQGLGMNIRAAQNAYILRTGAIMIIFTLLSAFCTILVGLIAARNAAGAAMHIRSDIFRKVENFSGAEFDSFSTASLITRSTNDVTQVQLLIFMMTRLVIYAPIMGIGGVIRALGKAPSMAWIIGLAVLVLLLLVTVVVSIAMPKFRLIQKLTDRLNRVGRENLSGIMVVRAFNRQKFEEDRFDQANTDLTKINLFVIRVMVIMMPVIMLIMNLLSVMIIWIGAKQIEASSLQIGDMMAFLQYAMQIVMSFMMLTMMFIFLPRAAVSAGRISEVLKTEPSIKDPEVPEKLPEDAPGRLEFRNVSFKYPGADEAAVCSLDFTARPGQTTAIIGSTGSGKTTIVNLIPRFYDICEGEILLDGIDIRKLSQKDLRNRIGYIPQKSTLFSGTIKSNLLYADENADDKKLNEVIETAQASELVREKEEGINAPISQAGINISGGQKQRLSIARALVRKFPVLIFDDSFSALDFKTDAALRRELKKKTGESTIIIVAQRVSTIMNAEQIIVLDEGRIVGKGTHKELMKSCREYSEIVMSQLDIKELA